MEKNIDVNFPGGGFEDIMESDLKEFGDIENPGFFITSELEAKMADLACLRLENAKKFVDKKEYDVAVELTKSAIWLFEILNKRFPYEKK